MLQSRRIFGFLLLRHRLCSKLAEIQSHTKQQAIRNLEGTPLSQPHRKKLEEPEEVDYDEALRKQKLSVGAEVTPLAAPSLRDHATRSPLYCLAIPTNSNVRSAEHPRKQYSMDAGSANELPPLNSFFFSSMLP